MNPKTDKTRQQSALVTILNRDVMTPEMFKKARAEHAAILAGSNAFEKILSEVEELIGCGILTDECDLAKQLKKFKAILKKIAAVREGKAVQS